MSKTWDYCFDRLNPQPLQAAYTADQMKAQLTEYFRRSYVDKYALKYNSGITLRVDDCKPCDQVQLGFCGRVLLNAFNALEYGEQHQQQCHSHRLSAGVQPLAEIHKQDPDEAQGWAGDAGDYFILPALRQACGSFPPPRRRALRSR